MKKSNILVILILSVCVGLFSACVGEGDISYLAGEEVSDIQLIYYDNPQVKENPTGDYGFDKSRIEVLETLDEAKHSDFLADLCIRYKSEWTKRIINSNYGYGIAISYESGELQVITLTEIQGKEVFYVAHYNNSGEEVSGYDLCVGYVVEHFKNLVEKYFATQVEFN